ncbi:hypothetical protein D7147_27140 [Micromonospora musae]|uniref:Uncharacterized protein n=1 Tax=Micromonospora musae TaxID=1894970 RepID=A0ABX9QYT1_9ACTN|nr:hypothetical protein [Micromonospora musae]RKN14955.1 hypothetical protein D7147_27140 [Micromonospora musae]
MEINSRPVVGPPGSPLRRTPRRVRSAALALAGLATFGNSHTLPWILVRPGQDLDERLLGIVPSEAPQTYALADLPGSRIALYLGWLALLAVLVLAWVRPQWRDGLRLACLAATLAGAALTFLPSGAAVDASGFPRADRPTSTYLSGTWLALSGLLLLSGAALAMLSRPSGTAAPSAPAGTSGEAGTAGGAGTSGEAGTSGGAGTSGEAGTSGPAPDESRAPVAEHPGEPRTTAHDPVPAGATADLDAEPAPLFRPALARASRRTARRRPSAVVAAALGAVALAAVATVLAWPRPDRPGDRSAADRVEIATIEGAGTGDASGGLAALLVTAPDDATPILAPVRDDKVDITRIVSLDEPGAMLIFPRLLDVRHTAGTAWTQPNSESMMVVLFQFDTSELAEDFRTSYATMERYRRRPGSAVALASVPDAAAFVGTRGDGAVPPDVHAVARHDDIVVLVTAGGGASDDVTGAEALLRRQYQRL